MKYLHKISTIIDAGSKRRLLFLMILLFITMIFEFVGIGILVPILSLIVSNDVVKKYPAIAKLVQEYNLSQQDLLLWAVCGMVGFYLIKTLFLLYFNWRQAYFNAELNKQVQTQLFYGYLNQPYSFHLNRNSSSLLYNVQSEVNYLSHVVQAVLAILSDIALITGVFVMLLVINPILAVSTLIIFAGFGFFLSRITKKKLNRLAGDREIHEGAMFKQVLQAFGGIKDVILLGKQKYFQNIFTFHAERRKIVFAYQGVIQQIPRLYFELLSIIIIAAIVVYYSITATKIEFLLPTIGLFMLASLRIMPSANRLSISFQTLRFAKPVINKLFAEILLLRRSEIREYKSIIELNESIEVQNLSYAYDGKENVLEGINLKIQKGETVGFLGPSGSGKSTLIDAVLGILTPETGNIFVDGKNIFDNVRCWQNQIGYVPQAIFLLDDTIKKNIAFGVDSEMIDDAKIDKAVRLAHLSEFIKSIPAGVNTMVGERGVKLSGGQRQRIGLARALYHDPEVLVLDEATSALDHETESEVMNAIKDLQGQKTIIIIAHRTSTMAHCDKLYKIEKGRITRAGSPLDLNIQ